MGDDADSCLNFYLDGISLCRAEDDKVDEIKENTEARSVGAEAKETGPLDASREVCENLDVTKAILKERKQKPKAYSLNELGSILRDAADKNASFVENAAKDLEEREGLDSTQEEKRLDTVRTGPFADNAGKNAEEEREGLDSTQDRKRSDKVNEGPFADDSVVKDVEERDALDFAQDKKRMGKMKKRPTRETLELEHIDSDSEPEETSIVSAPPVSVKSIAATPPVSVQDAIQSIRVARSCASVQSKRENPNFVRATASGVRDQPKGRPSSLGKNQRVEPSKQSLKDAITMVKRVRSDASFALSKNDDWSYVSSIRMGPPCEIITSSSSIMGGSTTSTLGDGSSIGSSASRSSRWSFASKQKKFKFREKFFAKREQKKKALAAEMERRRNATEFKRQLPAGLPPRPPRRTQVAE